MNTETENLKYKCLRLINDYDALIRMLVSKIEPDRITHAKLTDESIEFIDVDDVQIDAMGISYDAGVSSKVYKLSFYLPWTHFNIDR